jgi:hypothetical protein
MTSISGNKAGIISKFGKIRPEFLTADSGPSLSFTRLRFLLLRKSKDTGILLLVQLRFTKKNLPLLSPRYSKREGDLFKLQSGNLI